MKRVINSVLSNTVEVSNTRSCKIYATVYKGEVYQAFLLFYNHAQGTHYGFLSLHDSRSSLAIDAAYSLSSLICKAIEQKGLEVFEFSSIKEFHTWIGEVLNGQ
ncbi:MAG: hypothetical protein KAS32_08920 [Candidatus Peribacteraceae bacterium]|nr:hypothetical protein [Candidatus Peribacteraceae bacterium]